METSFDHRTPDPHGDTELKMTNLLKLVFRLMLDRRIPLGLKLILPVAAIYLISPLDIVPDILPVLGRVDDILVILIALAIFLGMAPRKIVAEHLRGAPVNSQSRNSKCKVIDGQYRSIDDDEKPTTK